MYNKLYRPNITDPLFHYYPSKDVYPEEDCNKLEKIVKSIKHHVPVDKFIIEIFIKKDKDIGLNFIDNTLFYKSINYIYKFQKNNKCILSIADKLMGLTVIKDYLWHKIYLVSVRDNLEYIPNPVSQHEIIDIIKKYIIQPTVNNYCFIESDTIGYLKNYTFCEPAHYVPIPKIHKKVLALRPIISHNKAIQPQISKLASQCFISILSILQLMNNKHNIYINVDVFQLVHQIKDLRNNGVYKSIIISGDIKSYYTSMRNEMVHEYLEFLKTVPQTIVSQEKWESLINFGIRSFEIIQQTTYIDINGRYYRQKWCTNGFKLCTRFIQLRWNIHILYINLI